MDRLSIINDALLGTGNNTLNVEFDGSPEWLAAESGYRRAVAWALSKHTWKFASRTANLAGLAPSSPSKAYANAFTLPSDALHVETVYYRGYPLSEYELIGNSIASNYDADLSVKYVVAPAPGQWPFGFVELVTLKTEAYLLAGLNEDADNARKLHAMAQAELEDIRPLIDKQEPAQAMFRSRSAERRLGRVRGSRFNRVPYGGV